MSRSQIAALFLLFACLLLQTAAVPPAPPVPSHVLPGRRHPVLRADLGSIVSLGGALPDQFVTADDNGGSGLSADASVLTVAGGLTVEDNEGFGVNVTGGRLIVNGVPVENVFRHNGAGLNLDGTVTNFNGQNTIQNNEQTGV